VIPSTGTPFVGNLSFAAAGGPTAIPIYVVAGSATAYTLQAGEFICLTNITITTNDATPQLVTVDDGAATAKIFAKGYVSTTQVISENIPPGICFVQKPGQNARATVAALTAAKTVEVVIKGYIVKK
jgi:predicted ribosome-associated RNA-binding protein Tma20